MWLGCEWKGKGRGFEPNYIDILAIMGEEQRFQFAGLFFCISADADDRHGHPPSVC